MVPGVLTLGSLFTGIRGLDLGLERAGFQTVFACESDPACQRIIARTAPGVPILADVREIDAGAPRVDLLAGGFPCPDFSYAGKRIGFAGERAQLWYAMADCVRLLRPRLVLVENVPGLIPAIGVCLADLAAAGYVGSWLCLRAVDVGAPHRRERVFILATSDADGARSQRRGRSEQRPGERAPTASDRPAPPDADGRRREQCHEGERRVPLACAGSAPAPPDADGASSEARRDAGPDGERARLQPLGSPDAAPYADGERGESGRRRRASSGDHSRTGAEERDRRGFVGEIEPREIDWGAFEPAIRRWEQIFGRAAPGPTDDRGRLNAGFVEWMMGFPDGWTEGESRTARLRMLGNAVQVQVAELAGRLLLEEHG